MRQLLHDRPRPAAPLRGRDRVRRLTGVRRVVAATAITALAASALVSAGGGSGSAPDETVQAAPAAAAAAPNPVTPGDFTGYGFDQCLAPTQRTMDTWLQHSPYLAVGIYISGKSRACRSQPNLTAAWVSTQLAKGWRLLPITLGPQASCQPRFPRYSDDASINPARGGGKYGKARAQGQAEGVTTVADAQKLGLTAGSTLWYDLEGFTTTNVDCRESALSFLSAWTTKVQALGYVAGVYSSAGSGLNAIDDARVTRPNAFNLPTRIWMARWDGVANTSTSYLREDGWRPGGRVKQYRGGHDETWGGARINIDTNFLDLGTGSVSRPEARCGGTRVDLASYPSLKPASASYTAPANQVRALQCLLREQGLYQGPVNGTYNGAVTAAVRAWQTRTGVKATNRWFARDWITLAAAGGKPVLKRGSAGADVRRVQRALVAARVGAAVPTGSFDAATDQAVRRYQRAVGVTQSGVVNAATWSRLVAGKR